MKIIRLILILIIGGLLTHLTYKFQFQVFFGEAIIWFLLIIIGILILIWTIIKDIKLYNSEKKIQNFGMTFLCIAFVGIILTLEIKIQKNFNKPTLLKVYYDGDFN